MPPAIINVCRLSEEINTPLEAAQRQAAALLLSLLALQSYRMLIVE